MIDNYSRGLNQMFVISLFQVTPDGGKGEKIRKMQNGIHAVPAL